MIRLDSEEPGSSTESQAEEIFIVFQHHILSYYGCRYITFS